MNHRKLPVGAEIVADEIDFRVWAPALSSLILISEQGVRVELDRASNGYFTGRWKPKKSSVRYQLELPSGERIPDPASRFQPDGPHGPSQVIDPTQFVWTDQNWRGRPLESYILYEMHVGTFTPEGTWAAAQRELPELAAAGFTVLEIMPVAEFPGKFGWGYDGVSLFAPTRLYGTPDDFRRFVDAAHRHEIAVILDVVYNHLGPDGNYLEKLSPNYFSDRHTTDWGRALNFDGECCEPVREFYLANAGYWVDEFHVDGLRLDATQAIKDDSPREIHLLTEIARRARAAGKGREIIVIAETDQLESELCRPESRGGCGLDGIWNDDFHHAALVAMTGRRDAYFGDYRGEPQEFVSSAKYGGLYHGQRSSGRQQPRGRPGFDLLSAAFISFVQNHDQIGNSCRGLRLHELTTPGRYRAFLALLMLSPGTPMLFQGQEFCASTPFCYFTDHLPELARLVTQGRRELLAQVPEFGDEAIRELQNHPNDERTFQSCRLDLSERHTHAAAYQLCQDLIRLRQAEPAFRSAERRRIDGAVLGPQALVIRYFLNDEADRLLLVNWGPELALTCLSEPLLAPPERGLWTAVFSTDGTEYDGPGLAALESPRRGWVLPAESAVWLKADMAAT